MGFLSPYGLIWNLAVSVFMGCFCLIGSLVFVRIQFCMSLFLVYNVRPIKGPILFDLFSGVTKPLRAWAVFGFVGPLVQVGRGRHSSFEWVY